MRIRVEVLPPRWRREHEDAPDNGESAAHEALCRLVGPQSRYFLSGTDAERTTYFDFFGEEPGDR